MPVADSVSLMAAYMAAVSVRTSSWRSVPSTCDSARTYRCTTVSASALTLCWSRTHAHTAGSSWPAIEAMTRGSCVPSANASSDSASIFIFMSPGAAVDDC